MNHQFSLYVEVDRTIEDESVFDELQNELSKNAVRCVPVDINGTHSDDGSERFAGDIILYIAVGLNFVVENKEAVAIIVKIALNYIKEKMISGKLPQKTKIKVEFTDSGKKGEIDSSDPTALKEFIELMHDALPED